MNKKNITILIVIVIIAVGAVVWGMQNQSENQNNQADNQKSEQTHMNSAESQENQENQQNGTDKQKNNEIIDDSQTQQEPEVITSDIDTSDWQTYRNEELGFSFRYPGMWRYVEDESGGVKFYDTQKPHYLEGAETFLVSASVREVEKANLTIEELVKNWTVARKASGGHARAVKINDFEAVQGISFSGVETFFHVDGHRYYMGTVSPELDMLEIYNAMLLSWKPY